MTKALIALLVFGLSTPLAAQPRPGAFTTLVTTDTSVASICAGGNSIAAPSTCTGGLQAGPTVVNLGLTLPSFTPAVVTNRLYSNGGTLFWNGSAVAVGGSVGPGTTGTIPLFTGANAIGNSIVTQTGVASITVGGLLLVNGFGTSQVAAAGAGANIFQVRNTAAGVANYGRLGALSDTVSGFLDSYSSTFTTATVQIQASTLLSGAGVGGLSLAALAGAGAMRFFTGGTTQRGQILNTGEFRWETFGLNAFSAGGAGLQRLLVQNSTAGAGNGGSLEVASNTVSTVIRAFSSTFTTVGSAVQGGGQLLTDGIGGLSLAASHAAGVVRIYTGSGTLRATFDAAGNFNLGSTNIMDSPAVPTIAAGFGASPTIAGRTTGFVVTISTASGSLGTVNFNTTFTNAPVCVASDLAAVGATDRIVLTPTTTSVGLSSGSGGALTAGGKIYVLCRGY